MDLDSALNAHRFLTDENVSKRVAEMIGARGHEVFESRNVFFPGAADRVIEVLARHEGLIISHDRDFKDSVNKAVPILSKNKIKALPLIWLNMQSSRSLQRTTQCWCVVEHHLDYAGESGLYLQQIEIKDDRITVRYRLPSE